MTATLKPIHEKIECDFCGEYTDGKFIFKHDKIKKDDGSNIELCSDCADNFIAGEYDKIKLKGETNA